LATIVQSLAVTCRLNLAPRLLLPVSMLELLVVEDEKALARNIKVFLESFREEFHVTVTDTGEAALHQLSSGAFDLLVADFRLPGIDGLEVLRHALARNPGMRAIMMTAYPSDELRKKALRSGAVRFVEKPLDMADLRLLLWETIECGGDEESGLTVREFVELLELAGESQGYRFRFAKDEGVVVVDHGCLVHAATATLSGPEAFERMASWVVTDVEEMPHESARFHPHNIEVPLSHQILEAAGHLDGSGGSAGGREQPGDEKAAGGLDAVRDQENAEISRAVDSLGDRSHRREDRTEEITSYLQRSPAVGESAPFRGSLADLGFSALLCLLCEVPGTWKIEVRTPGSSAVVYVADGSIVHAAMGAVFGEDAAYSIVTWEVGEFELEAVLEVPRQTLTPEWSSLFLRAFA